MQDEGIIKNFWTEINTTKLGYSIYRIYINYQDVGTDVRDEIIQYFSSYKNAWAVLSVKGPIDLDVLLWVKDSHEFSKFWNKTLEKYGKYFANHTISILTGGIAYKKSYLVLEDEKESEREYFILKSGGKTVQISEVDAQLLNQLASNARTPLVDLAKKIGCSSQIINYRMKNLIKNGIILAFRVGIDISKLGLQNSVIDIYLKDYSQRKNIIDYMKNNPYVEYIIEPVGWCDIQFELMVKGNDHLIKILEDIDTKFPGAIRRQDFWMSKKYHRLRSLPELYQ
jgi:Lrp/AsnC family transcriptional regulator for asnA, asnC and gidA